jgi:hypothetical protein
MPKPVKPSERADVLKNRQKIKLAWSAECYVRGTPTKFYEWLDAAEGALIPNGAIERSALTLESRRTVVLTVERTGA